MPEKGELFYIAGNGKRDYLHFAVYVGSNVRGDNRVQYQGYLLKRGKLVHRTVIGERMERLNLSEYDIAVKALNKERPVKGLANKLEGKKTVSEADELKRFFGVEKFSKG